MATATPEKKELTFSDLLPSKSTRALNPNIKEAAGTKIRIVSIGAENMEKDGKTPKAPFFITTEDGKKFTVPPTIAKKVDAALAEAKKIGQKNVPATVTALDRGVRLS